MLGKASTRRGHRRISSAVLLALGVISLILLAAPVRAEFRSVDPRWVAWQWTTDQGSQARTEASVTQQVRAVAVRPDGWLIVAAANALHLVPPWGGSLTAQNVFGPRGFYPFDMVMRDGALYATVQTDVASQPCNVFKIDPFTGQILASYGWSQCYIPHITVDPLTDELVMQASESPPCPSPSTTAPLPFAPGTAQPSDACPTGTSHPIVEWNPDTGTMSTLVSNPATPYSDLGFTADGEDVYLGEMVEVPQRAPLYIDAYSRHGGILPSQPDYRIQLPDDSGVSGMTVEEGSNCFGRSLVYTDAWSDVFRVANPGPGSTASVELASTPSPPGQVRYADAVGNVTKDPQGNPVVGEYNSVMLLGCPGFRPPAAPLVTRIVPRLSVPHPPAPRPPAVAAPAAPAQPPPPVGGPPTPAPALGASQGSTQMVAAPNAVGVGDVVEDQPAFHLTATARPPGPLSPLGMAGGALAVSGMAAGAWLALSDPEREERRVSSIRSPAAGPPGGGWR